MAPLIPSLPGYRDLELIAHGNTSLVFRARQENPDRPVAVKLLLEGHAVAPETLAQELELMVQLSTRPHIVSVIDAGVTDEGHRYTVMELCEGGSYAQTLAEHGPLPVADVLELGQRIGEALDALHRTGVVHGDVRPGNILRSRSGPALTGFGISRGPQELTGAPAGRVTTLWHASPETLLEQAQSGLSDVYSLGSTMWTLLAGYPPFVDPRQPTPGLATLRDRVLHDPVPYLNRDDVPPWLREELSRALAKRPAERHGDAGEFSQALRRGTHGQPTPAPDVPGSPGHTVLEHTAGLPVEAWPVEAPAPAFPYAGAAEALPVGPDTSRSALPLPAPDAFATRPSAQLPGRHTPDTAPDDHRSAEGRPTEIATLADGLSTPSTATGWEEQTGIDGRATGHASGGDPAVPAPRHRQALPDPLGDPADATRDRWSTLVALLVGTTLLASIIAAALVVGGWPRSASPVAQPPTAPSITGAPASPSSGPASPTSAGPPTGLHLDDRGTSITISWHDPSNGRAAFVVSGSSVSGQKLDPQQTSRNQLKTAFTSLDPKKDYCFVVVAVYSVSDTPVSRPICTKRT